MIGRLAGQLIWRGSDHIMIDVSGVGYIVYVNERTLAILPQIGGRVTLFTELVVREDLLQLFGFPTMIEREWHRLLTTVQGVGAKASMAILSQLGPEGTARAITLGDAHAVQAAQGVGPKLAQRVVNELKSKAPAIMAAGGALAGGAPLPEDAPPPPPSDAAEEKAPAPSKRQAAGLASGQATRAADALSALINLGYGQGEAAQAIALASAQEPELGMSDLIRRALKELAPKAE